MHFGYPGENTHLEQHGVSEESFWPSFTDIMMVIVMVFLLVTVAVILNNWTLINDLKDSIKAQQVASSLAENTQVQNFTLEEKLIVLEHQVEDLSKKYQDEKSILIATQQELVKTRGLLLEKETSLSALETTLVKEQTALDTNKKELIQKQQILTDLQVKLNNSNKQIDEKLKAELLLQQKLGNIETEKLQLKQQLTEKEKETDVLTTLQSEQRKTQEDLERLKVDYSELQTSFDTEKLTAEDSQTAYVDLEKEQQSLKQKLQKTTLTLDQLEQEKTRLIAALNAKLNQRDGELQAKNKELLVLKEKQSTEDTQLRSLQGEYNTLDAKYQKLLLPARSSKGKFVVSILYRKKGGRRVIRLKSSAAGAYKPVSERQLHNKLAVFKRKYKTELYLKVVIPENSGLSYSEAWKFTNGLQTQYDYYYQKKSN